MKLLPFSAWSMYLKLGLLAVLVVSAAAGSAYVAWKLRASTVPAEIQSAVDSAAKQWQDQLAQERELRVYFQGMADDRLARMLKLISNINRESGVISQGIAEERQRNREFYEQQLPPGGYEQWMRARQLVSPQQ